MSRRRTANGLTRERVLQAGLKLIDREGVDALTMRRLGKELGVEAMSLYGYVANKQDLLDGVLDSIYAEMPRSVATKGPWQERVRITARQFREVLLRHPNAVGLVASRPVAREGGLGVLESALSELRSAGLDLPQANQVLTVVVGFTVGHLANRLGDATAGVGAAVDAAVANVDIDGERFPNVAERASLDVDPDAEFDLGLDFIVEGIQRLLDARDTAGGATAARR